MDLLPQATIRFLPVWNAGEKDQGILQRLQPNQQKRLWRQRAPIRNGGRWSLNWRVINLFKNENGRDDEGLRLQNQRRKIAGSAGDGVMKECKATGRWYSPQMGLEALREATTAWQYPPSDDAWETRSFHSATTSVFKSHRVTISFQRI